MKKYLVFFLLLLCSTIAHAQMSDQQVLKFIQQEQKAGTSQGQIVIKLQQRGVKVEQIQRLRKQYDQQLKQRGLQGQADGAVSAADSRLRKNNAKDQQLTAGQQGTATELNQEADLQYAEIQQNINEVDEGKTGPDSLKVFGRDIFNNKLLSFEPNMNIATPQNYVLGPGDQVVIDIYGASQKSENLTVSPDGDITVPGYGPIHVAGLTVAGAQSKIRGTLGSRYASSSLKIGVGQTRSIMVNVMGEVKAPGTYTLSAFATVFHAL